MLRALVVEDDPAMRQALVRMLSGSFGPSPHTMEPVQFVVESLTTGQEALVRIRLAAPDVLILDDHLPDITGRAVLQQANLSQSNATVIFITGYPLPELADMLARGEIYDLLAKPFTPEELRVSLRRAAECLLLRRLVGRLAERTLGSPAAVELLLAQELSLTLDAVRNSLEIIRQGNLVRSPEMLNRVVEVALGRLNQARSRVSDMLRGQA